MKGRILTTPLILLICLGQALAASLQPPSPRVSATRFYRAYLRLNVRGLPSSKQANSLSPFLSSDLRRLFQAARRKQAKYIHEHPSEKPPWIEGDLFTSLFEGATSFRVGSPKVNGNRAEVPIYLEYRRGGELTRWMDTLVLTRVNQEWRVWDILYQSEWFNNGESLRSNLSEEY